MINSIINKESIDASKISESDIYGVNSVFLSLNGMTSILNGQIISKNKGAHCFFNKECYF